LSPSLTGEIELRASGSVGFTNLTIYYLDWFNLLNQNIILGN
jgi:hypothetical protein